MFKKPTYEELEAQLAEQQQAQRNLEESNIQMLDMLESISDGFFSLDEDLIVTYFNGAAERLLGRKSWEILGRSLFEAFPETAGSIFEETFQEAMKTKRPHSFETYFPINPYENWYDVRVYPRQNGISVFFRVTTEKHRVDDANKRLERQLRKAKKMQAVATLASRVANDFNNLLSVIQSGASLVLFDLHAAHPHYEILKRINQQARNGTRLGAQLLGYARKGRYSIENLDMDQMVNGLLVPLRKEHGNIRILHELSGNSMVVQGDRHQIEDVLRSVLANSIEAMSVGGKLTVQTKKVTDATMEGNPWDPKPGPYVMVSVTDTGIGMDKETLREMFTPFFTTKTGGQGAGLGMAAAYGIVKGHGGYIDIVSKEGAGTVVKIFLPGRDKSPKRSKDLAAAPLPAGKETILIVDDETQILDLGSAMLEKLGYSVLLCKDGMEAIALLKKKGEQIALVLLDMVMPEMGGGEVFKRIKAMRLDVRIVLTTGCSLDGEVQEVLEKGCDGFLQKPFGIQELSEKVSAVLGRGDH